MFWTPAWSDTSTIMDVAKVFLGGDCGGFLGRFGDGWAG